MPRYLRFFSSKKRAASFKEEKTTAPSTDGNKNMDASVHLPMQRSASLFHFPVEQTPGTRHGFYPHASQQSETEKSTQWEIRSISGNSSVAHSKSPGGTTKHLDNNSSASSSANQLCDSPATRLTASSSSIQNAQKVSNSNSSTKPGNQIPSLFSPTPTAERAQSNDSIDAFESFDLLNEARKIFRSLIVDISNTFDTMAKSPALPLVIEKYSGSKTASGCDSESSRIDPKQEDRGRTTPKWTDSPPSSEHEESMEILAALQVRCLEYREMMRDYSKSIFAECRRFTESSIPRLKSYSDSISSLRDNFSNFKELCKKLLNNSESGCEGYPNLFTNFMQVTLLHTLEEQNESYLTRLQSGVNLIRAHCKFVRYEKAASLRIETLMRELDHIRRFTIGHSV